MSRTILATHAEGVLRVFSRGGHGDLVQVAQMTAAAIEPAALLTLVSDLDLQLDWAGNGAPPPLPARAVPALGPAQATTTDKRAAIIEQLAAQGPQTIPQLGGESRRYHVMRLLKEKQIESVGHVGAAELFALAPPAPPAPFGSARLARRRAQQQQAPRRRRATHDESARRRQAIIEQLDSDPVSTRLISDETGLTPGTVRKQLAQLLGFGLVERVEIGANNASPVYGWRLPSS